MVKSGVEHDGFRWAEPLSREAWAERAGISFSTFTRLTRKNPIQKSSSGWGGDKVVLLRVGDADPKGEAKAQDKYKANTMAKLYREHMAEIEADPQKWVVTPRADWGRCMGLVECWPDGWEVKIFKNTLRKWPDYMDCVKYETETAYLLQKDGLAVSSGDLEQDQDLATTYMLQGEYLEKFRRNGKQWVWQKPHLGLMRRFAHIAINLYEVDSQNFAEEFVDFAWEIRK